MGHRRADLESIGVLIRRLTTGRRVAFSQIINFQLLQCLLTEMKLILKTPSNFLKVKKPSICAPSFKFRNESSKCLIVCVNV